MVERPQQCKECTYFNEKGAMYCKTSASETKNIRTGMIIRLESKGIVYYCHLSSEGSWSCTRRRKYRRIRRMTGDI